MNEEINVDIGKSGYPELEKAFLKIQNEQFELFCKKQKDYGPMNIAKFGEHGVLIRVSDKVERLINLHKQTKLAYTAKEAVVANEPIDDTWTDVSIYGIIALLNRRGEWPKQ